MPVRGVTSEVLVATEDFVCQLAAEQLHAVWSEARATWDLNSALRSPDQRRQDYLTLLKTIHNVKQSLDALGDQYAYWAKSNGADFAEIGAMSGVSRQAARQRHLRQTVRRSVALVGGPWDGRPMNVLLGESVLRLPAHDPWLEERPWLEDTIDAMDDPVFATYRRSPDDPDTYRFQRYENPDGSVTTAPDHSLRIYRLANCWGLYSGTVLRYARKLNPQIRGEASRLDPAAVEAVLALVEEAGTVRWPIGGSET